MKIDRNKHNIYVANTLLKTPEQTTTSTGTSTGAGSTTIIYTGGGGSGTGLTPEQSEKLDSIESGAQVNQNAFSYLTISNGEQESTQAARVQTDTAKVTILGEGVTVELVTEVESPERTITSTGIEGQYTVSYHKVETEVEVPSEEGEPTTEVQITWPLTITYVSGTKIKQEDFDTLKVVYNGVDTVLTDYQVTTDTEGITSITKNQEGLLFDRIVFTKAGVDAEGQPVTNEVMVINAYTITYSTIKLTGSDAYWKLDEDGNLFTTYNAYSTQELSAYGLGETSGGSTGGVSFLKDLEDVDTTNLINGGILQYNSTTKMWEVVDGSSLEIDMTEIEQKITELQQNMTTAQGDITTIENTITQWTPIIEAIDNITDWFSFVDGKIRANYDLWGVGEISAYGYNTSEQPTGKEYLKDLLDVDAENATKGQILVFNGTIWVNQDIPETGLNESELAQYLTQNNYIQESDLTSILTNYATKEWTTAQITQTKTELTNYTDTKISNLIGTAPDNLDTLGEIAEQITLLQALLDWFSFIDGRIRANYDLWSVGEISAYGMGEGSSSSGKNYLHELEDVSITPSSLTPGQLLQYNGSVWVAIDKDEVGLNETELEQYLTTNNYLQQGDVTWSNLSGKPSTFNTTIQQINDLHASWDSILKAEPTDYVTRWPSFNEITNKPTTLEGYGITNTFTKDQADDRYVNITGDTMTGDLLLPNLEASGYIMIGSAVLSYDSTNKALKLATSSGGTMHFYATGEVSAYGYHETEISGAQYLHDLLDVNNGKGTNPSSTGTLLMWDGSTWAYVGKDSIGLNIQELQEYLETNNYVQSDDLTNYATQSWVQQLVTDFISDDEVTALLQNYATLIYVNNTFLKKTDFTADSILNLIEDYIDSKLDNYATIAQFNTLQTTVNNHTTRIVSLEQAIDLLNDMFEWDNGKIKAKADLYGVGEVSAYGIGDGSASQGAGYLHELDDVSIVPNELTAGQLLQYDGQFWVAIDKDEVGLNETELDTYLTQNNYTTTEDLTWNNIQNKPETFHTTLSFINDLHADWGSLLNTSPTDYVTRWPTFAEVTDKPTTVKGYGITDVYTKTETDNKYVKKTGDTMTGPLVVDYDSTGTGTELRIVGASLSIIAPKSGDYARSYSLRNSDNDTTLTHIAGVYGRSDTIMYTYYGGTTYDSPAIVVLPSKFVGINTTSPAYQLDVTGNVHTTNAFYTDNFIQIGNGRLVWDQTNNAIYAVSKDGTSAINFYSTGEVSAYGSGNGEGSTGKSYLHELEDVDISDRANNDMLVYNSATKMWETIAMSDVQVNLPSWVTSTKPTYTWTEIQNKPSWIGDTKPTYTAAEVGAITQTVADDRYIRQYLSIIGANTDLNNYTDSGLYSVSAASYSSIENFPSSSSYSYGILASLTFTGRGIQWYVPDYNNTMAVRTAWEAGRWNNWHYLLTNYNYTNYTVTKTGSGASGTWGISITGSASKLGTTTVGSATSPIYLNQGVATAVTYDLNATLNSGTSGKLAYYSSSTAIDDYTSTIGSGTKLWYLSSGIPTNSSSTVGSGTKLMYLSSGTLTASSSTLGDQYSPVYLSSGTITASTRNFMVERSAFPYQAANWNDGLTPGMYYISGWSGATNYPTSSYYQYGTLLLFGTTSSKTQFYFPHSSTDRAAWRTTYENSTSRWSSWHYLIDSQNYATVLDDRYVKKTGDSMTGTLTNTASFMAGIGYYLTSSHGRFFWDDQTSSTYLQANTSGTLKLSGLNNTRLTQLSINTVMASMNGALHIQNSGFSNCLSIRRTDSTANASIIFRNSSNGILGHLGLLGSGSAPSVGPAWWNSSQTQYNIASESNHRFFYDKTIDLSSYSTSNFYPYVFTSDDGYKTDIEVMINSESGGGDATYNANHLHFRIRSGGWTDNGFYLDVLNFHAYQTNEITIGSIGTGTQNGGFAVWLRGGVSYKIRALGRWAQSDIHTSSYSFGGSTYTVGTNRYGGSNSNVTIQYTPTISVNYANIQERGFGSSIYYNRTVYFKQGIQAYGAESKFYTSTFTDPATGTAAIIKATGNIALTGNLIANGEVTAYKSSDMRLKTNIIDLKGIDLIRKLRPVEYDWTDEAMQLKAPGPKHAYGLIAQEVEQIVPEVVNHNMFAQGYLGIDYTRLIPLTISAIKDVDDEVTKLKKEVKELKKRLNKYERLNRQGVTRVDISDVSIVT